MALTVYGAGGAARELDGAALEAGRIIKEYKPVLSLAAYHRPADKKVLPKVILGLRDDYKTTLNTFAKHDFYCE